MFFVILIKCFSVYKRYNVYKCAADTVVKPTVRHLEKKLKVNFPTL